MLHKTGISLLPSTNIHKLMAQVVFFIPLNPPGGKERFKRKEIAPHIYVFLITDRIYHYSKEKHYL